MNTDLATYIDSHAEIVEIIPSGELELNYNGEAYNIKVGDKFNRLTVECLLRYKRGKSPIRKGCICSCKCGNHIGPSLLRELLTGELQSCGCYSRDIHSELMVANNTTHGESKRGQRSELYALWAAMLDRVRNTNRPDAKYYANKGVTVASDWEQYELFRDWAINHGYKPGLSIERIDVDKGYNPENCTFIEVKEQAKNRSSSRFLEYNGRRMIMSDWLRETGLDWSTVDRRLKRGLSVGKALGLEQ